jgi:hypothetical protein
VKAVEFIRVILMNGEEKAWHYCYLGIGYLWSTS